MKTYLVGGAVRDRLLGRPQGDRDWVVVGATPEAMLALANSQVELKDTKGARKTLEDLVKQHPQSEAAGAAKERIARLK